LSNRAKELTTVWTRAARFWIENQYFCFK